ncbi:MAG: hypothetical protein GF344_03675 [Chitinivibrionales bacterium]|nr:hypothetical protein [Chitinivibrionales bacterium]
MAAFTATIPVAALRASFGCALRPSMASESGFSVDTSVRIEANDQAALSRLVGYISRCPISLARMITRTADGKIVYRASHAKCWAFPKSGEQTVMEGIPRNHEMFSLRSASFGIPAFSRTHS